MKNKKRKKLKKEKLEKLEIKNYEDTRIEEKRNRTKKESKKKKRNERKIDNQIDEKVQLDVDGKIEKRKARKRIFVLILIILVVLLMMFLVSLYKWNKILKDIIKCENSVVVDSTGNVIAVLGESRIQEYVKLENIPKNLVNAYVSIEDKNFYKHNGINVKRTAGAVASYVFNGGSSSFGGSTITQQLVKNITGDNETKISRKVQEWDRAIKT